MISWSRHVTGWATLLVVGGRILYCRGKRPCHAKPKGSICLGLLYKKADTTFCLCRSVYLVLVELLLQQIPSSYNSSRISGLWSTSGVRERVDDRYTNQALSGCWRNVRGRCSGIQTASGGRCASSWGVGHLRGDVWTVWFADEGSGRPQTVAQTTGITGHFTCCVFKIRPAPAPGLHLYTTIASGLFIM